MDLEVTGQAEFKQLARRFRAAGTEGKQLRVALRRELKEIADPIAKDVKSNALGIPSKQRGGGSGLRRAIAKATQVKVAITNAGVVVKVWVNPGKMPAGQRALPTLMEGKRGRWRHPVFGTDEWVNQASHPYFGKATDGAAVKATAAARRALDETARKLNNLREL